MDDFKHHEWDIQLPLILKMYQWIGKNVFEPIMNSAHMAEVLVLGKALDKNVDYLIVTQAENEMRAFQKQVYILHSWKSRS